jgi:hypothetical protein
MVKIASYETKTLVVTVKTYPTPSAKYIETTCVSGVTDDGHWIRLHPVNFRSLEEANQFPRYSRIRVRANKATRDHRPESYHIDIESIEQLGVISTENYWGMRREVVEPMLSSSLEDLAELQEANGTSLGVIRPKEIIRFRIEDADPNWSSEQLNKLSQHELFSPRHIPQLEKIPHRFIYEFICDDPRCNGHKMQVFDWEVAQAYRKWRRGKTRAEWEEMFRKEFDYRVRKVYDSLFFVGTLAAYPKTWIIGGIFYAPKKRSLPPQPTLL